MKTKQVLVLVLALLASACGSVEPTEAEIKAALEAHLKQSMGAATVLVNTIPEAKEMAAAMLPAVKSVKKIACKADGQKPGYNCDVQYVTTSKLVGEQTTTSSERYVKGEPGWIIAE